MLETKRQESKKTLCRLRDKRNGELARDALAITLKLRYESSLRSHPPEISMTTSIATYGSVEHLRSAVRDLRCQGRRIGFVPTMGYLHAGHISLVEISKRHSDQTIVSIFVNPTQFNDARDLEKYPRDIPRDMAMLEAAGACGVFLPSPGNMYSPQHESWVEVSKMGLDYEGAHRPGHFRGVTTVVSMLFNCVQPDIAVFGEKDFQQLRLIERMVDDLKFPLRIVRGPLVREPDGLAMSSRNVRLDADSRKRALGISRGLFAAQAAFAAGERRASKLRSLVEETMQRESLEIDYIEVVREETLQRCEEASPGCRILVAATVGGVRLIDNIALGA